MSTRHPIHLAIETIQAKYDADVAFYVGDLMRFYADRLIEECRTRRGRRKNILLVLSTYGGDPNAAYRIARAFQHAYGTRRENDPGKFYVMVASICKSAGTLLCLGADELLMADDAELGPIDVQLRKPDEVGERTSGLTPLQALDTLQIQSIQLFKAHFGKLKFDEELLFSTKMAAEIATNLTVGLLTGVYAQIDPLRLAEVERAVRVSTEYGQRIGHRNLKPGTLERLLVKYPSHSFVIDKTEATELFEQISAMTGELVEVADFLQGEYLRKCLSAEVPPFATYWTVPPPETDLGVPADDPPRPDGPPDAPSSGEQPEVRTTAGADGETGNRESGQAGSAGQDVDPARDRRS